MRVYGNRMYVMYYFVIELINMEFLSTPWHSLYIWLHHGGIFPVFTQPVSCYRVIGSGYIGVTSIVGDTQYGYAVGGYVGICGRYHAGIIGSPHTEMLKSYHTGMCRELSSRILRSYHAGICRKVFIQGINMRRLQYKEDVIAFIV